MRGKSKTDIHPFNKVDLLWLQCNFQSHQKCCIITQRCNWRTELFFTKRFSCSFFLSAGNGKWSYSVKRAVYFEPIWTVMQEFEVAQEEKGSSFNPLRWASIYLITILYRLHQAHCVWISYNEKKTFFSHVEKCEKCFIYRLFFEKSSKKITVSSRLNVIF